MMLQWLKPYMPRSLYGRATLTLLLPVITVLLVVSVVFIQRHFEGVTQQMTASATREIRALIGDGTRPAARIAAQPLAEALDIAAVPLPLSDLPRADRRRWYDFSGLVVIREFRLAFAQLQAVELTDDGRVRLYFRLGDEGLRLGFNRRRVSARNPHQLLVNMVGFGALMTVISYLYLRNQLRPIARLAHAAEAFGRGQHIPYRPKGAEEVRAAGRAFVDMRARIERQIEQRTLMLSGVSHDLRTPLTRLKLGLSMTDDDDSAALLRDVADMERLLDGFLAFARGARDTPPEPVEPVALVRGMVEDAARARIAARLVCTRGAGTMMLRPDSIRRAVENLINNAVQYGTRAEVSVRMTERSLRIRVEDDGPGIPPESRGAALRPFTRLDPARNQDRGTGVGLGLSIVIDIARAHGGTLRLGESERLGGLCADIVIARDTLAPVPDLSGD